MFCFSVDLWKKTQLTWMINLWGKENILENFISLPQKDYKLAMKSCFL
jgi:hypothetical protein